MILQVRGLGRAQLGDSSVPRRTHKVTFPQAGLEQRLANYGPWPKPAWHCFIKQSLIDAYSDLFVCDCFHICYSRLNYGLQSLKCLDFYWEEFLTHDLKDPQWFQSLLWFPAGSSWKLGQVGWLLTGGLSPVRRPQTVELIWWQLEAPRQNACRGSVELRGCLVM